MKHPFSLLAHRRNRLSSAKVSQFQTGPCRRRRGSTLVEFALIVPILIAMLIGIMEFGILTNYKLRLSNAVREGARYAALGKTPSIIRDRIKNYASPLTIADSEITLQSSNRDANPPSYISTVGNNGGGTSNNVPAGDLILVSVDTQHRPLTNFFPFLRNYRLKANVVMRRE